MIVNPSIQAMLRDNANNGVYIVSGSGAPTNGTTGLNVTGKGSLYIDYANGNLYINTGTSASPAWTEITIP